MSEVKRSNEPPRTSAPSTSHGGDEVLQRLIDFLEIDPEARENARELLKLFVAHADDIVVNFYHEVQASAISPHVTDDAIERLKPKQKAHWDALFGSNFGDEYAKGVRRIGIQHRDIALNVMWYIAGYAKLKLEFVKAIVATELPPEKKGKLLMALEKYVAVDMALALSSYEAAVVD